MQRVMMLSLSSEQDKAVQEYLRKHNFRLATLVRILLLREIKGGK
jgi:hypothetical protein